MIYLYIFNTCPLSNWFSYLCIINSMRLFLVKFCNFYFCFLKNVGFFLWKCTFLKSQFPYVWTHAFTFPHFTFKKYIFSALFTHLLNLVKKKKISIFSNSTYILKELISYLYYFIKSYRNYLSKILSILIKLI